jgi:PEP-CTERM motif
VLLSSVTPFDEVRASSSTISFELAGLVARGGAQSVGVPEPSSLALVGAGLLGLCRVCRRHRG